MRKIILLFVLISFLSITFVHADTNFQDCTVYGNCFPITSGSSSSTNNTYINNTIINGTTYSFNATQFNLNATNGVNIIESYIRNLITGYGYITTWVESDPIATANINANNSAWLSTFNSTYQTWAYNQSQNLTGYALLNSYNQPFTYPDGVNSLDSKNRLLYDQNGNVVIDWSGSEGYGLRLFPWSVNNGHVSIPNGFLKTSSPFGDSGALVVDTNTYLTSYTETDPLSLHTGENATIARTGNCPAGQVVQNTTTGGVQCVTPASSSYNVSYGVAGSNGQIQYNNNGAFGADGNFTFNKTSGDLLVNTKERGTFNPVIQSNGSTGSINFYNDDRATYNRSIMIINNVQRLINDMPVFASSYSTNSYSSFGFFGDGKLVWGTGAVSWDAYLSRNGTSMLRLDSDGAGSPASLNITGNLSIGQNVNSNVNVVGAITSTGTLTSVGVNSNGPLIISSGNYLALTSLLGTTRIGLKYGSAGNINDSNIVSLSNREINGVVQIDADNGTGGAGGEKAVATFNGTGITSATFNGNLNVNNVVTEVNQSFVYVARTTSILVPTGGGVYLNGTATTDTLGEWNGATGTFTAKNAGVYYISAQGLWVATLNTQSNFLQLYNSNSLISTSYMSITGAYQQESLNQVAKVVAGGTLKVLVYHTYATSQTFYSDGNDYIVLTITRIA